jgi:hypothetical protein
MDTQALLDICRANEAVREFDLNNPVTSCGSAGCLIGNWYFIARRNDKNWTFNGVSDELGITLAEAAFLFSEYDRFPGSTYRIPTRNFWQALGGVEPGLPRPRHGLEARDAAIRRVRKFIFYKLHKRELCYDENGCVRETIRRAEGNHNVTRSVLEKVESLSKSKEICHA